MLAVPRALGVPPIADALRRLLDIRSDTSNDDASWRWRVSPTDTANPRTTWRLGVIVGLSIARERAPRPCSPREEKELTVAAIVALVEAVAGSSPTLLIVEDLHWADPSTLDVLDVLIADVERLPLRRSSRSDPRRRRRCPSNPATETLELQRIDDVDAEP